MHKLLLQSGDGRKIGFCVAFAVCVFSLSRMPYFNLFLTSDTIIALLWITLTVLWRINSRVQFGLAVGLLVCSLGYLLWGLPARSESLGNAAYLALVLGVIQMMRSSFR